MSKLENRFQSQIRKEIIERLDGAIVTYLNPNDIQGIPDILILYENKWATLEVKKNICSPFRPNQEYWIGKMNDMSFSRMICPENKEEVLDELQRALTH